MDRDAARWEKQEASKKGDWLAGGLVSTPEEIKMGARAFLGKAFVDA